MARRFLGGIDLLNQLVTAIGAQMSTGKLLGRSTAGSGAIEEISIGSGLSLSGGTLSATGGGGGGLTKFTEAESTASPNATVYVDSLTAAAASTNADVALVAKGSGATLAQVPDGTTAGGNKRGQYATDLQKSRSAAANVASGSYSTLSGGKDNQSSNVYTTVCGGYFNVANSSYSTVGGGANNTASGAYTAIAGGVGNTASSNSSFVGGGQNNTAQTNTHATVCGGSSNTASGQYSFVGGGALNNAGGEGNTVGGGYNNIISFVYGTIAGGYANQISSPYAFIGGGQSNLAFGAYSAIPGGRRGTARGIQGNFVFPACSIPIADVQGVTQSALLLLGRETTNATATVLASNSSAAGTTHQVILPNNSAYSFSGEVIAGVTGGGDTARWTINGAIKRGASAATTAMVGTPTVTMTHNDAGAAAWTVAVTADTTNGGIKVEVTGAASTTIRWVCKINTTEMTY